MLLIASGDWHVTGKNPRARIDDYFRTQVGKIRFIYQFAVENSIPVVLQPGDMFDTPRQPHAVVAAIADVLHEYSRYMGIVTVATFGQHDLFFHNTANRNIPMEVLGKAGLVKDASKVVIDTAPRTVVYTAGWGEEIPVPEADVYSILLTHRMVIPSADQKAYVTQTEYEEGHKLLSTSKFDLIVCGDNHSSFVCHSAGRHLINCGSLMRSTVAQVAHEPCFYVVDTVLRTATKVLIPIQPSRDVIDLSQVERKLDQGELNKQLDGLVQQLQSINSGSTNFKSMVFSAMRGATVSTGVVKILKQVLGSVE